MILTWVRVQVTLLIMILLSVFVNLRTNLILRVSIILIVPSDPDIIGITVTFIFHNLLILWLGLNISWVFSSILTLWSAEMSKFSSWLVHFFLSTKTKSGRDKGFRLYHKILFITISIHITVN